MAFQQEKEFPRATGVVLLVEDDSAVRRLFVDLLGTEGFHVLAARNCEEAMDLASEHDQIDILVIDVMLPDGRARDLAEKLGDLRCDLRLLYTSGFPRQVLERSNLLHADTPFLQKPFGFADLKVATQAALADRPIRTKGLRFWKFGREGAYAL